jgi:signal peptidase I
LHTAVFFLAIFLFVRTFAVEPFGVPTGSMAPTLLGNHREAPCPRCGFRVIVGDPGPDRGRRWQTDACCPNCGRDGIDLSAARDVPGDRLLVDKNVFAVRSPRRWEVAVFRCPVDDTKPYVKRVVGLPGEAVRLVGGDVFADGVLRRKTLAQTRETRLPVFDMDFAPPGGWNPRWLDEPVADTPSLPAAAGPTRPADESRVAGGEVTLDGTAPGRPAVGLTYRHWNLDEKAERPVTDALAYNGRSRGQPVHDFVFTAELEVRAGDGTFALRLGDGRDTVRAEFPVGPGGKPAGVRLARGDDAAAGSERPGLPRLEVGRTYRIEFAFVDRRASLAVDGTEVVPAIDLPTTEADLADRRGVSRPVQLGVRGASVVLRHVALWRDIHYTAGTHAAAAAYRLGADEYFLVGDNSANSHDSREWAVPGVPERDFLGKPFLIHQPLRPATLTLGGRERSLQTVDWARLRWVR